MENRDGGVGRSAIHDNDFCVRIVLVDQALDSAAQKHRLVERRGDDAYAQRRPRQRRSGALRFAPRERYICFVLGIEAMGKAVLISRFGNEHAASFRLGSLKSLFNAAAQMIDETIAQRFEEVYRGTRRKIHARPSLR